MDRGLIILQLIVDRDTECVAPGRSDSWAWALAVDKEADLVTATSPVTGTVGDVERIAHSVAGGWEFL